jgi:hypothetical protein
MLSSTGDYFHQPFFMIFILRLVAADEIEFGTFRISGQYGLAA